MSLRPIVADSRTAQLLRALVSLTFFSCGVLIWVFKLSGSQDE